jgi:hypothetical protein
LNTYKRQFNICRVLRLKTKTTPPPGGWTVIDSMGDQEGVQVEGSTFEELVATYRAQALALGVELALQWCRQRIEHLICSIHIDLCWSDAPVSERKSYAAKSPNHREPKKKVNCKRGCGGANPK